MFSLRNVVSQLPKFSRNLFPSHNTISISCSKKLYLSHVRWKTDDTASDKRKQDEVPGIMSSRYEVFSEQAQPHILDIEEERQKKQEPYEDDIYQGINLERGEAGVFEIEDLVYILKREKAVDIVVLKVPPECNYSEYMVIVTGRSTRHMLAMSELIRKIFKKKMFKTDIIPKLEGKTSTNWMALDLGNIVLHVFSKSGRELYDLDSLWSVGKEYDSLCQKQDTSTDKIFTDYTKLLAGLTPDTPIKN